MGKKLIDGQEFFDGQPVAIYEGKFTGSFEMVEESAAPIANDDQITFIVTARVDSPKFSYIRKTGDLKRANTMKIEGAFLLDPQEARYLLDNMGESVVGVNDGLVEGSSVADEQEGTPMFNDWNVNG